MLASIWLRLSGESEWRLRSLILRLAAQNGTVPFEPHLTLCGVPDLTRSISDAVADYVGPRRPIFTLRCVGVSCSAATPFKAVVIDLENAPALAAFRDDLRKIAGGGELEPPHVSLLYPIDEQGRVLDWASDEAHLRAVANEAMTSIDANVLQLGRPVIVTTEGSWVKIRSWKTVRAL